MKTILIVVAVITAGYCGQAQTPQQAGAGKIGYANMEYIISKHPDMKQIETEMKSTQTQLRNQIQTKSQAVQKQYADFNANMKSMVDSVRANRQRDLEGAMGELEKMQQDAQVTLQNKQKLYMAPLYLKINKAISEVAKENGYDVILTDKVSSYSFLLFRTEQLDISDLVLKKFGVTAAAK